MFNIVIKAALVIIGATSTATVTAFVHRAGIVISAVSMSGGGRGGWFKQP